MTDAAWFLLAWRKLGFHERILNKKLSRFLMLDTNTLGDPALKPWCGDFVETCIALALPEEPLPENPYGAQNWKTFGTSIRDSGHRLGAVMVFWRGSPTSWNGHVGFYNGEDDEHFSVLGGNQGNRVSVMRMKKERLLDIRWPATFPYAGADTRPEIGGGEVSTNEE